MIAFAVVTLAHEAQQSKGTDEATAECYGVQLAAETAETLGASRAYGERLARTCWARYGELEALYRSPDCRDGGKLDRRPESEVWP